MPEKKAPAARGTGARATAARKSAAENYAKAAPSAAKKPRVRKAAAEDKPSRKETAEKAKTRKAVEKKAAVTKAEIAKGPATAKPKTRKKAKLATPSLLQLIEKILDDGKAEDVRVMDLKGRSSFADTMVIATGRSGRQVAALAEHIREGLKNAGHGRVPIEGMSVGDWVLIDAGDVIIHLFRPEVRTFYNLEKMWGEDLAETEENTVSPPAKLR